MAAARIHILFARESSYAVVIRRGPSKHVCTVGWDRDDNSFSVGQWLKGRIYGRRSDLSPDGKHMIYFAMNGRWESETRGSWTAISKAPYLKAIGLWGKGDCWNGGGVFLSNSNYWINRGYGHIPLLIPEELTESEEYPFDQEYGAECTGVYYPRLQRDGWKLIERKKLYGFASATVFEKEANSIWKLRKIAVETINPPKGRGCYYDEHQLCNMDSGEEVDLPHWEWAEVDHRGMYWAEKGRLFIAHPTEKGLEEITELCDLNGLSFDPIKAPY